MKRFLIPRAGFILRMQIYAVYADHFAHLGRVFSVTNADLRRRDRADAEYLKVSLITLTNRAYSVNNMLYLNTTIVLCEISI